MLIVTDPQTWRVRGSWPDSLFFLLSQLKSDQYVALIIIEDPFLSFATFKEYICLIIIKALHIYIHNSKSDPDSICCYTLKYCYENVMIFKTLVQLLAGVFWVLVFCFSAFLCFRFSHAFVYVFLSCFFVALTCFFMSFLAILPRCLSCRPPEAATHLFI